MQSEEPCPDLLLHPAHCKQDWKPVVRAQVGEFFSRTRLRPVTAARHEAIHHYSENLKRLNFELDPFSPRLTTDDGKVSISLHLPRTQLGFDRQSGLPLLTIEALEGSTGVWAILILADLLRATHVLEELGKLGVIRSDFGNLYTLQESPLAQGRTFAFHAIASRKEEGQDMCQIVGKVANMTPPSKSSSSASTTHEQMLREASVLAIVQGHPNVVRLHGIFEVVNVPGPQWILSMELCPGGDLRNAVANGPLSENQAQQTMMGLASALSHVHARGVVHRNVQPANILLASDGRPVLTNFELAVHISAKGKVARQGGMLSYMAPEVLASLPYGCKADCFSAGCVLHFLLSGTGPYMESNEAADVLFGILHGKVTFEDASFNSTSGPCKDLIMRLLQTDAEDRLAMDEALAHPWLAQQSECAAQQSDGKGPRKQGDRVWDAVRSLPGSVAAAKDRIWSKRARERRQSVGDQHGDGSTASSGTLEDDVEVEVEVQTAAPLASARRSTRRSLSVWRLLPSMPRFRRCHSVAKEHQSSAPCEQPKKSFLHSRSANVQSAQRFPTRSLASVVPADS